MSKAPTLEHPCCFGITLQQGTKIIAAIRIAFDALLAIIILILMATRDDSDENTPTAVLVILFILLLISVGFHVLLFLGANTRAPKKVKIFLIFYAIIFGLSLLTSIHQIFTWGSVVISVLSQLPQLYQGHVVYKFYKEIENEQPGAQQIC